MLDRDLKRGSTEMLIMAMVEDRPRHGYEIGKLIEQRSNGVLQFHVASLYPLLYRLEKRGFVRRKADPDDRRKVLVEAADETRRVTAEAYLPLRDAGAESLAKYSEAELKVVADVLADSLRIQEDMTRRLLERHGRK